MKLSRFFTRDEMTRSETARREGIPNDPGPAELGNLRALCAAVLDPLRESLGQPIKTNSGYRSPQLNRRIGGAADSQHVRGMAADIQASGVRVLELFKRIIQLGLPFDQVIYEAKDATTKWVHVSHDTARNRGEIRIAEFGPNGRPVRYPIVTAETALALQEPALAASGGSFAQPRHIETDDAPSAHPPAVKKKAAKRTKRKPAKGSKRKRVGTVPRKTANRAAAAQRAAAKAGARRARG